MAAYRLLAFRLFAALSIAGSTLSLSGCSNFFVCQGASCPGSGSGSGTTNSGDYAYVSNSVTGSTYINGYSLSAGTLSVISGFPADLTFSPSALVVSPDNAHLYAASTSTGYIYAYAISTSGNLSIMNSGKAVATPATGITSMDVSPDGNYLFALDGTGSILYSYQITTSTGLLTVQPSFAISSTQTITPQSVRVSPNKNFVVCSLGTGGDVVFPYSSSSGITNSSYASISTGSNTIGDYGLSIDTGNNIYIARTTGVAVYTVTFGTSTYSVNSVTEPTLSVGAGSRAIALSSAAGANVYVGNFTDGTISGYSSTSGTLANLTGSPFTAPPGVNALARDNSNKYILALGYDSSAGIRLYNIGSAGALTSSSTAGSGTSTSVPAVIALTH